MARAIVGLFTLKLESEDSSLGLTRTGSGEVQDLVVVGYGGPVFVDIAAEVEAIICNGFRGWTDFQEELIGMLRWIWASLIVES